MLKEIKRTREKESKSFTLINKEDYSIKSILFSECQEFIYSLHYVKSKPVAIKWVYGLFKNTELLAVIIFSQGVSQVITNLFNSLRIECLEISRLVMKQPHNKNLLSYFVCQVLKLLPKPLAIVAYSDIGKKHHGYIYQSLNFHYIGIAGFQYALKSSKTNKILSTRTLHKFPYKKNLSIYEKLSKYHDYKKIKTSKKHRYITFLGSHIQKKIMLNNLKYPILPYPKGDNEYYEVKDFTEQTYLL